MTYVFDEPFTKAVMKVGDLSLIEGFKTPKQVGLYTFIRTTDSPIFLNVDNIKFYLLPNQIIALTPIQYLQYTEQGEGAIVYQFNQEFYCIKDHDKEVSCQGILFFGNAQLSIIDLDAAAQHTFDNYHEMLLEEIKISDTVQGEMLRILLKKFIIKSTRLIKDQKNISFDFPHKLNLLREFNMLVETHFKNHHQVSFYADQMNKSPKTLSNTFHTYQVSPSQIIQERIVLEAKRLLAHSNKSSKEIGYELGFEDASNFSRVFKNHEGISPSEYRKNLNMEPVGKN